MAEFQAVLLPGPNPEASLVNEAPPVAGVPDSAKLYVFEATS